MTIKEKYRILCKTEDTIPLFSQYWWLDATCGPENWNVVLVEKGGTIMAALPFMFKRKYGLHFSIMPPLTQTLGPWLRPSKGKITAQYNQQKKLMTELIQGLPKFDYFSQNFHHTIFNWLPFYWHGFSQTTRYTYILQNIKDHKKIFAGFQGNIRGDIKKALNRFKLKVRWDIEIDSFFDLNELTFNRQRKSFPFSKKTIKRIDTVCADRNARKIIGAQDADGRLHAAVYIIWDQHSAYYLMGGSDPNLRRSGANSLCIWEAIKFASAETEIFDFEGSMIEPVERFFRAFGAQQIPYLRITYQKKIVRFLRALKNLIQSK